MVRKSIVALLTLFFTLSLLQVAEAATKATTTTKRYVPPLQSNLSKNKPKLIKLFKEAGIENAEELFSDPRLKLHKEFWVGGAVQIGDYGIIMNPESIRRGKETILNNYEFLELVEQKYGVPKEILVSIFRVETNLGRYMGNFSVFNSLLTWTVSGTRRWKWAQDQLITFVIICKQLSLDPFDIPGSTHGAFGLLQFIPTSFVRFAVPWNPAGIPDLFNFEDAIASSANYLKLCGWNGNGKRNRRSIYAYNASTPYVNAVFKYSKAIAVNSYDAMRFTQAKIKIKEYMTQTIDNTNESKIEEVAVELKEQEIGVILEEPLIKGNENKLDQNI